MKHSPSNKFNGVIKFLTDYEIARKNSNITTMLDANEVAKAFLGDKATRGARTNIIACSDHFNAFMHFVRTNYQKKEQQ